MIFDYSLKCAATLYADRKPRNAPLVVAGVEHDLDVKLVREVCGSLEKHGR